MADDSPKLNITEFFMSNLDMKRMEDVLALQGKFSKPLTPDQKLDMLEDMARVNMLEASTLFARSVMILEYIIQEQLWKHKYVSEGGVKRRQFENQSAYMEWFMRDIRQMTSRQIYVYFELSRRLTSLGFDLSDVAHLIENPDRAGRALSVFQWSPTDEILSFEDARIYRAIQDELGIESQDSELDMPADPESIKELAREWVRKAVLESDGATSHLVQKVRGEWTCMWRWYPGEQKIEVFGWSPDGSDRFTHSFRFAGQDLHPEALKFLATKQGISAPVTPSTRRVRKARV